LKKKNREKNKSGCRKRVRAAQYETDRLLAQLEALEWLQAHIVVLTLGISNNNSGPTAALGI
jgi:hypothetical protein